MQREGAEGGEDAKIRVVHAAARYVVVEKPTGMLSVPGKGVGKEDCVAARVRGMFPGARGPLVVHRLDMETSGLLVLGLDEGAQRELSGQFEARLVGKRYVALVEGEVVGQAGEISLPLRPDLTNRPYQIVDRAEGREAVTRWRVAAREVDRTRVDFEPLTGRTHQLRVHASHPEGLGRPIIGDVLYGREEAGAPRLMLHAAYLSFLEPGGARRVEFVSGPEF